MQFDWHDAEHDPNQRGFGFDVAARIFAGRVLLRVDDRRDYGEVRVKVIGEAAGVVLVGSSPIVAMSAGSSRPAGPA